MKNQFWKLDHNQAKRHPPDHPTCTGHDQPQDICRFYWTFWPALSSRQLSRSIRKLRHGGFAGQPAAT
jgi:hypothetical protein